MPYAGEEYVLGPPCAPSRHNFAPNGKCWSCHQNRDDLTAQPDGIKKEPMDCHYVECHVIVAEDPEGRCLPFASSNGGWWGSRLEEDTSKEEAPGDMILTTRRENHDEAVTAIKALAVDLRERGFSVKRGKVEIVTFDSKKGDAIF